MKVGKREKMVSKGEEGRASIEEHGVISMMEERISMDKE
jgi:hypothetical protein